MGKLSSNYSWKESARLKEIYRGISGLKNSLNHLVDGDKDNWAVKDMIREMRELLDKIEEKMK